jgi:hypothetical protein
VDRALRRSIGSEAENSIARSGDPPPLTHSLPAPDHDLAHDPFLQRNHLL